MRATLSEGSIIGTWPSRAHATIDWTDKFLVRMRSLYARLHVFFRNYITTDDSAVGE